MANAAALRVAGIDWATQPKNRAAVALDIGSAGLACVRFQTPLDDAAAIAWCRDGFLAAVGVDIPFGWPSAFCRFVSEWRPHGAGEAGRVPADHDFRFRATDVAIHEALARRGVRKWPLSVSTDRIALATAAWVRVVGAGGLGPQLDVGTAQPERNPRLLEVYPGCMLALLARNWMEVDARGYKDQPAVRARILARLMEQFSLACVSEIEGAIGRPEGGHVLDALLAALTAWMCLRPPAGWTVLTPCRQPERRAADQEGWIWAALPEVE